MLNDVDWNKLLFLQIRIVTKQKLVMILVVSEEGSGAAALSLLSCSIPTCQSLVGAGRSEGTVGFWSKPMKVAPLHLQDSEAGPELCCGFGLSTVKQLSLAVDPCSYVTMPSTQLFHHKGVY